MTHLPKAPVAAFSLSRVLLLALALTAAPAAANTQTGGSALPRPQPRAEGETLFFVIQTNIPGPDATPLVLCGKVRRHMLGFLPLRFEPLGYALAERSCAAAHHIPLSEERFRALQAAGSLPADLAATPELPPLQKHWLTLLATVAALLAILVIFLRLGRHRSRHAATRRFKPHGNAIGNPGKALFAAKLLSVLCHAARADGPMNDDELEAIAIAMRRLTGQQYFPDEIAPIAADSSAGLGPRELASIAEGLSDPEKEQMMRAALLVVVADNTLSAAERRLLASLAQALAIDGARISKWFTELTGRKFPPASAA